MCVCVCVCVCVCLCAKVFILVSWERKKGSIPFDEPIPKILSIPVRDEREINNRAVRHIHKKFSFKALKRRR